jgi:hypothetical protein
VKKWLGNTALDDTVIRLHFTAEKWVLSQSSPVHLRFILNLTGNDMVRYIYLNAIGLTPGGSGTVHIYTQTAHRIQRKEHIKQSKN